MADHQRRRRAGAEATGLRLHYDMKWLRASLLSQGLLALYFQLIQWLPLGSWNYQPEFRPLGVEAIQGRATASDILFVTAVMAPFVVFWFAYSSGLRWLLCPDGGGAGAIYGSVHTRSVRLRGRTLRPAQAFRGRKGGLAGSRACVVWYARYPVPTKAAQFGFFGMPTKRIPAVLSLLRRLRDEATAVTPEMPDFTDEDE